MGASNHMAGCGVLLCFSLGCEGVKMRKAVYVAGLLGWLQKMVQTFSFLSVR